MSRPGTQIEFWGTKGVRNASNLRTAIIHLPRAFLERWRAFSLGRKIADAPTNICTDKIEDFR